MDDAKIEKFITTTAEQLLVLAGNVASLRAAVNVLKLIAATQMLPDDPGEALKQFQNLEKILLAADSTEKERKEGVEIIDALKALKSHGGSGKPDS